MSAASVTPVYLVACAVVFSAGYGLPMVIAPLAWARRFGWDVRHDPLTNYFGRCLGWLILCISAVTLRVAWLPAARPIMLELLTLAFGAMIVVHLIGWIRRTQPWLETVELPIFVLLTIATAWLRFQ
jgi:hypothetical protein